MKLRMAAQAVQLLASPKQHSTGWLWRFAVVLLMFMPLGLVLGNAGTEIALSGIATLFLLYSVTANDWAWLRIRWVPLAVLIWLYYIAISFQAIEVVVSLKGALAFVRFILFGVACQYWLFCHERIRRWIVYAIAAVCVFAALDTWFQFFWGVDWFGIVARKGASWSNPIWPWQTRMERLTALSARPKIGGTIIMMAWPALVYWLSMVSQPERSVRVKFWCLIAAFLVLLIVPLTGERTSAMWMVMGTVLMYLMVPQVRKGLWYLIVPFILAFALTFHAVPTLQKRMLGSIPKVVANAATNAVNRHHQADNIYTAMNRTAINLFKANPIFGVGLKQFDKACQMAPDSINKMRPYRPQGGCNNSPQNMYLEFLVNTGLVGTALFMALMLMWVVTFYRNRRHFARCEMGRLDCNGINRMIIVNQPVMLGVLIAWGLRIFPFVTTTSFYFSWGGLIFWWMGAWMLAYCDAVKQRGG